MALISASVADLLISFISSSEIFQNHLRVYLDYFVFASVIVMAQYHKDDIMVMSFLGNGE